MVGVGDPVQVPVFTVHVDPTVAEPETVGATVFAGAAAATAVELSAPAMVNPRKLFPATCAVKYDPTSAMVDW